MTQVKRGLQLIADEFDQQEVDGVILYWHGEMKPPPVMPDDTILLLQAYDECVGSYSETKYIFDVAGYGMRRPVRGAYVGVMLRNNQLAGFWRRTIKPSEVIVDVQLYERFDAAAMASLQKAVDEHAAFLGRRGVLTEPVYL